MLARRDIVRFKHADEVPPLLRGHYAEIDKLPKQGLVLLTAYTWATERPLLKISRRLLQPVEPDEAARLEWVYARREAISEIAPSIRQVRTHARVLERTIQDALGASVLERFWVCHSEEDAVHLSRREPGAHLAQVLTEAEKHLIRYQWTGLLAAEPAMHQAISQYLGVAP